MNKYSKKIKKSREIKKISLAIRKKLDQNINAAGVETRNDSLDNVSELECEYVENDLNCDLNESYENHENHENNVEEINEREILENYIENLKSKQKVNTLQKIQNIQCLILKNNNPEVVKTTREFLQKWTTEYNISLTSLNSLLHFLKNFFPDLPADARTVLNSMRKVNIISVEPGIYSHSGIRNGVEKILNQHNKIPTSLKLDVFVDGFPIFKNSSENSCWVLLGRVYGVDTSIFLIGIYLGKSQPARFSDFLRPYVDELKSLKVSFLFNDAYLQISERVYICDSPARSDILGCRQHNAKNGCNKCVVTGRFINGRMCFYPAPDSTQFRTNESFRGREDPSFHRFDSPLEEMADLDMVKQFPNDPFHLLYSGLCLNLLNKWFAKFGRYTHQNGSISKNIKELLRPCDFQREFLPIEKLGQMKGSQLRAFLLFLGPVMLYDHLPPEEYNLFLLLHASVRILNSPLTCLTHNHVAHQMLLHFVDEYSEIFGEEFVVQNVHSLTHLAKIVKEVGKPLEDFAAFPFESFLSPLKNLVRSSKNPLQQIVKRVDEMIKAASIESVKSPANTEKIQYKNLISPGEYSSLVYFNRHLDNKGANSFVLTHENAILKCSSFFKRGNLDYVSVQAVLNIENFFTSPIESSHLLIYKTSRNLSDKFDIELPSLSCKMMRLNTNKLPQSWIFFPFSRFSESSSVLD